MKKRLRFELPKTPLKVSRGEQEQEDIRDQYHQRFQAPGTTTEDAEDGKDIDDESRRSSLSHDDVTTDIGEVSEEGGARYLGRATGSIESANNDPHEIQNYPNNRDNAPEHPLNAPEHPPNTPEYLPNAPEYDTTGSINLEEEDVQIAAQVHHLPDSDEMSNDDSAPLLANMH